MFVFRPKTGLRVAAAFKPSHFRRFAQSAFGNLPHRVSCQMDRCEISPCNQTSKTPPRGGSLPDICDFQLRLPGAKLERFITALGLFQ